MEEEQINNNNANLNLTNQRLCYEMDGELKLGFENGKFFKILKKKNADETLAIWPLDIIALVKQGRDWKIRYRFDKVERLDQITKMGQLISAKMHATSNTMSLFMQFIYKFKADLESKHLYEIWHDAVSVVDDVIKVNQVADQEIAEILRIIRDLAEISTNRNAFLTSFYYNLIAPLSFEIRERGQKFPYRLTSGRTHGGKTSIESLFVFQGYDQDIATRKENQNTVKTIFTFGQQVELSRFPFVIDDVSNGWLQKHSEELKGATDGVKFMARGTRSQEQNVWQMLGMPIFTMNAVPDIPLALSDRIIISHFTEEHSKRQDKGRWERIRGGLKPGFMLNIINETLEGKTITELLSNIHFSVRNDTEINSRLISYVEEIVNDLYRRYELETLGIGLGLESTEQTLMEKVSTYVYTQLRKYDNNNIIGPKFCQMQDKVLINSVGWEEITKYFSLRNMHMTDFANESEDEGIEVKTVHNPCLGKKARCIIMPLEKGYPNLNTTSTDE